MVVSLYLPLPSCHDLVSTDLRLKEWMHSVYTIIAATQSPHPVDNAHYNIDCSH